jgi:hypothetical protein
MEASERRAMEFPHAVSLVVEITCPSSGIVKLVEGTFLASNAGGFALVVDTTNW